MKKILLPLAMAALFAIPAGANAAPCRDGHGHFVKCGPEARRDRHPGPAMTPAHRPMGPAMMRGPAMAPHHKGPCKDGKGKFVKC